MKIYNKKLFKIAALTPLLALPIVLTSCGQVSQFGTATTLDFNVAGGGDQTELENGLALNYTTNPIRFFQNQETFNPNNTTGAFLTLTETLRAFSDGVLSFAHGTANLNNNPVFTNNPNSDLIREFLIASSNTLNQGGDGDLKLGISNIQVDNIPQNLFADAGDNLIWGSGTTLFLGALPTVATSFRLTYSYYSAGNGDIFNNRSSLEDVREYVGRFPSLSILNPTTNTFTVDFNLQVKLRAIYSIGTRPEGTNDGDTIAFNSETMTFSRFETVFSARSGTSGEFLNRFPTDGTTENIATLNEERNNLSRTPNDELINRFANVFSLS